MGRWWFGADNQLRQHTLWSREMGAAECALARLKMVEDYGPPTQAGEDQAVWVGEILLARWTDRTASGVVARCEVEWIDLGYFRR